MTEPLEREPRTAPEAGGNASRGFLHRLRAFSRSGRGVAGRLAGLIPGGLGGVSAAILVLGLAAGVAMIVAEFLPVWSVDVVTASCEDLADPDLADTCVRSGYEEHAFALFVLGAFTLLMTWGAAVGGSRPAGLALLVLGGVVLGIALIGDAPDVDRTGSIGVRFDQAEASAGTGFYLEIVGAVLALAAGLLRVLRPAREAAPAGASASSPS